MNQLTRKIFQLNHLLFNGRTSSILNKNKFSLYNSQTKSLIVRKASVFYENKLLTRSYVSSSKSLLFSAGLKNYQKTRYGENRYENKSSVNIDEDFEGAEPIDSDGQQVNFKSKSLDGGFSSFNIPKQLLNRLNELNYKQPYEIQEVTLKHTLEGKDLVGKAFTGSGKTLAFAIPIISKILQMENRQSNYPKCLILAPTRELCLQLTNTIKELAPFLTCIAVYGGAGMVEQTRALSGKVDIVCATPGRLKDLMERRNFVADEIEIVCLDEADELLTNNFLPQIKNVIELTNKKQMLMFSATISKGVFEIVKRYMTNPVLIDLTEGQKYKLPTNIEHYLVKLPFHKNLSAIMHYLEHFKSDRCIIFTRTKRDAKMFCEKLRELNVRAQDLHSDISQDARQRILEKFRTGNLNVLIATDVAARGIDVPEVNLVIQIGTPSNGIDYYIHRSGRTGRGGRPGKALLINNDYDDSNTILRDLSRIIKFKNLILPDLTEPTRRTRNLDDFDDIRNEDKYTKKFDSYKDGSFGGKSKFSKKSNFFDDDDGDNFKKPRYPRDSNYSGRTRSRRDDDDF